MRVTWRYWITVGLMVVLAVWAFVVESTTLLIGVAGIGAWLLTLQYRFVRATQATVAALTVEQQVDRTRVTATETTLGSLVVRTVQPSQVEVSVSGSPPVESDAPIPCCRLQTGETIATVSFELTWPVAGTFEFDQPTVTFSDQRGLFQQDLDSGSMPAMTVEPRAPRNIHVGEGGERVAAGFGEHDTGQTGAGLTPAEVRKYVPGDTIQQIDWKATARLNEPHIREFEAETDLETILFVDQRAAMSTGRDGETKLDFARQLALAFVENAQELGDPLGCYTIGDEGITNAFEPRTANQHYRTITQCLRSLETTEFSSCAPSTAALDPGQARRTAEALEEDDSFSTRLRPFFDATEQYVRRIADQPLFGAVRTATTRRDGSIRMIIITDDDNQTELREAVKVARGGDGQVLVFLTPSSLYEPGTLDDLEDAYRRYTEFESFRRDLTSLTRVSAFEVGPSDRLATILAAGSKRRQQRSRL